MASQYIVVVGCGRLGSILASRLSSQGNSVVVIDPHESSFNDLSSNCDKLRLCVVCQLVLSGARMRLTKLRLALNAKHSRS